MWNERRQIQLNSTSEGLFLHSQKKGLPPPLATKTLPDPADD